MKKFILAIASGLTMMLLSGCGGGGSDDGPVPETYFITDSFGDGVSEIIYHCDSGLSGITNFEGAFTFDLRGDNCNFDFLTNDIVDDLYIEYDNDPFTDAGIDGIEFECVENGILASSGTTGYDPLFEVHGYIDDVTFYDGCTLFDIY